MAINKPLVVGIGGIGQLVARLLLNLGMDVKGIDRSRPASIPDGLNFVEIDISDKIALEKILHGRDAIISCLPFHLTKDVAIAAHKAGIHYFDPTEDIETTKMIRDLAKSSEGVMIPQNGLAPGFIGIVGSYLAGQFDEGTLRHVKLRVGALPQHPIGQLGYAGNWSLEGLVHECIAECDIIANGKRQKVPALKNREIIRIDGTEYEAFTTSGGLGTMTETYAGKVETLNYKSIRYPGHYRSMKLLLEELRFREDPDELVARLANSLPPADQDRVLIHASVQGEINGKLQTKEIVADFKPIEISGELYTAIAWTTACSIVSVVEMVSSGALPQQGFVKQEDISLVTFLQTKSGSYYSDNHQGLL